MRSVNETDFLKLPAAIGTRFTLRPNFLIVHNLFLYRFD
jgi:hypothetical protein